MELAIMRLLFTLSASWTAVCVNAPSIVQIGRRSRGQALVGARIQITQGTYGTGHNAPPVYLIGQLDRCLRQCAEYCSDRKTKSGAGSGRRSHSNNSGDLWNWP